MRYDNEFDDEWTKGVSGSSSGCLPLFVLLILAGLLLFIIKADAQWYEPVSSKRGIEVGATLTPGRAGAGIIIGRWNNLIGYETGQYQFDKDLIIYKFTYHRSFFNNDDVQVLAGAGINVYRPYKPEKRFKTLSLEFGASHVFNDVKILALYDIVHSEGKVGVLFRF